MEHYAFNLVFKDLINLLLVFKIQNFVWVYTSKARGKEVVQELPAAVGVDRLAIRPSKTV